MDSKSGRKWIINAFLIFLPGLFFWIMAVLWVNSAAQGPFNILENLSSQLLADYGPDSFGQSMKSLKLAIFGDVFSDSLLTGDDMDSIELAMQGLVPTATPQVGFNQPTKHPTKTPLASSTEVVNLISTPSPITTQLSSTEVPLTPTKSATPKSTDMVPTATPWRQKVVPILDCVMDNDDGSHTAFFSYKNYNAFEVKIPIGLQNKITPGEMDRGQPIYFVAGRSSSYPDAEFDVVFNDENLVWHLDGESAAASANSEHCEPIGGHTEPDTKSPQISEGVLDPPPGELNTCSKLITVSELRVTDAPPSSGIAWVKLKYRVEGYSGLIYSDPLLLCYGGPTAEGGWDGCYQGSIHIEIDPSWSAPESGPFIITLFAKAKDEDGNEAHQDLGQYTMPSSCGSN